MNKATKHLLYLVVACIALEGLFWLNHGQNQAVWSMWVGAVAVVALLCAAVAHFLPKILDRWNNPT